MNPIATNGDYPRQDASRLRLGGMPMTKSTKGIETEAAQALDKNIRTLRDDELDLVCGGQKSEEVSVQVPSPNTVSTSE
jgi:hypothetical protein